MQNFISMEQTRLEERGEKMPLIMATLFFLQLSRVAHALCSDQFSRFVGGGLVDPIMVSILAMLGIMSGMVIMLCNMAIR